MGTNNFLTFCPTDSGTNLLTQSEYAIAADRTVGNQPGVASSKLVNKAIRQSAFITSQIAQYLANKLNANVLDDADVAVLQALFVSAFAMNASEGIENVTVTATVGASALTVALKTSSGGNASAAEPAFIGFRSSTLTSGVYNRRMISGALSVVVSSGSTLGQSSGQPAAIYVYAIDNAGTVELAVSHRKFREDELVSTTAEGGAGGADSPIIMYSATARSNVPCRLIAILTNSQTTAGTWAAVPTQIQLTPFQGVKAPTVTVFSGGTSGTYYRPAGCTRIVYQMVGGGGGGAGSSTGAAAAGATGSNSTFGPSTANGGAGGTTNGGGGSGGGATLGTGVIGFAWGGGAGGGAGTGPANVTTIGGVGGASFFAGGGRGGGGTSSGDYLGSSGNPNTGSGGGGAGLYGGLTYSGSGGGSGGYLQGQIDGTSSAFASSYSYSAGAGGAGNTGAGGSTGGGGGSGSITIFEFYD